MATNAPTIIVVFGATGDLMARKLTPAFLHLFEEDRLPERSKVVGFSRRDLSDTDFHDTISGALDAHINKDDPVTQTGFFDLFTYQQGFFGESADYARLAQRLASIDEEWGVCANKLFYLAVPPEFYEGICKELAGSGLTRGCSEKDGWTRILVEKPFGKDLAAAESLDRLLGDLFKEEQVYRIDHYLAKEALQNVVLFRFANNLLEEVWNNKYIERIDVRLLEELGVEDRGPFFDGLGALLDVGQNHVLQMLALTTMDNPLAVTAENIRPKRAEILANLRPLGAEEIRTGTVRGQYESYLQEPGVAPDSTTETYFKIKTEIDSPRWRGVPIFLESGKRMARPRKEIEVTFKHPAPCLCPPGRHFRNSVQFRLEPEPAITIRFWAKTTGSKTGLEEQALDYKYLREKPAHSAMEEYATLLTDCIAGDQSLFISGREAMAGWRFIDPIVSAWRDNQVPLEHYSPMEGVSALADKLELEHTPETGLPPEIGVIGLGKMGAGIARSLLTQNWSVVGLNRTRAVTDSMMDEGLSAAYSVKELTAKLSPPRIVWLMVPAGAPVDDMLFGPEGLTTLLEPGDIVIDGGNSLYKDTARRAAELEQYGLKYIDAGVSGGPGGARYGACLMVGGDRATFDYLLPLFTALAVPEGVQFFSGSGAGHFVKMVHNGIEYGMMQAIAEGFAILKETDYEIDLGGAAHIYNRGSVIESSLMGWLEGAFKLHGRDLGDVSGTVDHTGEAEWTVDVANELGVEDKVIADSLRFRIESEKNPNYTGKILTALRHQFGGHALDAKKPGQKPGVKKGATTAPGHQAANGGETVDE